jgi:hypothetical protein
MRYRRGRADRGPRCAGRSRRRLGRAGSRSAALRSIDGRQIGGQRPGRARTARIVLLQEQEQRQSEAALGKTACAVMTCRATVRKQPFGGFALIEILGVRHSADQHRNCAKDEQTARPLLRRHTFRRTLHVAVAPSPQPNRPRDVRRMPAFLTGTLSRVMAEQRQKGGGVTGRPRTLAIFEMPADMTRIMESPPAKPAKPRRRARGSKSGQWLLQGAKARFSGLMRGAAVRRADQQLSPRARPRRRACHLLRPFRNHHRPAPWCW